MNNFESLPLLNKNNMQELIDMLEEDSIDIFNSFINDAPNQIAQLNEDNADNEQLIMASHSLKSSAAYVGAERLSAFADEIEKTLRQGSSDEQVQELISGISEVLEKSLSQLSIAIKELNI